MPEIKFKQIKSFVLRQGKITLGQSNAIKELASQYIIDYTPKLIDLNTSFSGNNPKVIEIGFGMGHASFQIAQSNPEIDYLGIEVHTPGVGSLLIHIKQNNIQNIRIIQHDAVEVLKYMIKDDCISGFHIYFPDPWPKKRHHKRRIIQHEFIELLVQKLIIDGYIHLATDWQDYAIWILEILTQNNKLTNCANDNMYIKRPEFRPLTKFEQRGISLGHKVWDLMFRKITNDKPQN